MNVAYLARCAGGGLAVEQGFFSYFPPLKPRCVYSPKNTVRNLAPPCEPPDHLPFLPGPGMVPLWDFVLNHSCFFLQF